MRMKFPDPEKGKRGGSIWNIWKLMLNLFNTPICKNIV